MATTVINVSPCYANGKPLNEEFFVEDPSELLGKDYHFKVDLTFYSSTPELMRSFRGGF